ncbi:hypothetical protein NHQ30_002810 [Ciborinia camelliae]|nr:hypothetical protein NHQ30_002810 [Ciborinia camelliae]
MISIREYMEYLAEEIRKIEGRQGPQELAEDREELIEIQEGAVPPDWKIEKRKKEKNDGKSDEWLWVTVHNNTREVVQHLSILAYRLRVVTEPSWDPRQIVFPTEDDHVNVSLGADAAEDCSKYQEWKDSQHPGLEDERYKYHELGEANPDFKPAAEGSS